MGEKLKALKQGWRKVWPFLLWVLAALAVMGAIWALIYVPKMQVPVCPPDQSGLPPKICFDIENEARRTLAYILGGILAIIGIYMAHRRIRALERQVQIGQEQLQVAQEGQITERFTRAIEQLGSDKMEIRLGGIYALERIANDSDKDYWSIVETLTAYLRERAPWQEPIPNVTGKAAREESAVEETPTTEAVTTQAPAALPKPATDIQAVLTVLGRRKYHYDKGEKESLNLRNTDLRGCDLMGAHLEWAYLGGAHLEGAFLWGAHLEGAILWKAHMKGTNLWGAHLEGAELTEAIGLTPNQKALTLENGDRISVGSRGFNRVLLEIPQDEKLRDSLQTVHPTELQDVVVQAIETLPEKEKLVISLYYYEERTMEEISQIIGYTKSRISQLHTQAMYRLRHKIREFQERR